MSTRATILYDDDWHIYEELMDKTVHLEIVKEGVSVDIEIMPMSKWLEMGLPPIIGFPPVPQA